VVLPVYSAQRAPFPCLSPSEFDWFSTEQYDDPDFPWRRFDDHTRVHWTEAWDPVRDAVEFVPSALVYLPHWLFTSEREVPICPATSTGLACHPHLQRAAIDAIGDVIECDALSLLWYRRLPPVQVRVETLSDANYDLVSRFEKLESSVTLLHVPVEFPVFTVLAMLTSRSPALPARVFAAGTDVDPEEAIRKSLVMLAHARQYVQLLHANMPSLETSPGHVEVIDQSSHLRFWANHAHAHLADFMGSSRERVEFDLLHGTAEKDPETQLVTLIRRIKEAGYRVLFADLTTPDVRDAGFNTLRAVIPRLCPILYSVRTAPLGCARLLHAVDAPGTLRTCPPHPFPRKGVTA
jgi:ribosomal protein S12 methylthiotransferase accessory factor